MSKNDAAKRVVRTDSQSGPEKDPAKLYGLQEWTIACAHCRKVLLSVSFTDRKQVYYKVSEGGGIIDPGYRIIYVNMCLSCSNRNYFYEEGVKEGRSLERKENASRIASQLGGIVEDQFSDLGRVIEDIKASTLAMLNKVAKSMIDDDEEPYPRRGATPDDNDDGIPF